MNLVILTDEQEATARWVAEQTVVRLRANPNTPPYLLSVYARIGAAVEEVLKPLYLTEPGRELLSWLTTVVWASVRHVQAEEGLPEVVDDPALTLVTDDELSRLEALLRAVGEHPQIAARARQGDLLVASLPPGYHDVTDRRGRP